jgi:hypothetical protein
MPGAVLGQSSENETVKKTKLTLTGLHASDLVCYAYDNGYSRADWTISNVKEIQKLGIAPRGWISSHGSDDEERCERVEQFKRDVELADNVAEVDVAVTTRIIKTEYETCQRPGGIFTGCAGQPTYTVCRIETYETLELATANGLAFKDWNPRYSDTKVEGKCSP